MSNDPIARVAQELVTLDGSSNLVRPFSEREPTLSPDDGYRAAAQLHAARLGKGWRPVGRKIGFTNRTIWKRYGVYEPMWGMVYDRTMVQSGASPAQVRLAGLAQPRIEPEICFCLARAPGAARRPQDLLACIDWVAHSIEIVQCHHPDWTLKIADCTADNGLHGRLVVGTPIPVSRLPDLVAQLPALKVTLHRGDKVIDRGLGANVLDSPLNALAFLAELLDRHPDAPPLETGEIVSTGTLTDAHPVAPGETWRTTFEGLPLEGLEVTFQ